MHGSLLDLVDGFRLQLRQLLGLSPSGRFTEAWESLKGGTGASVEARADAAAATEHVHGPNRPEKARPGLVFWQLAREPVCPRPRPTWTRS